VDPRTIALRVLGGLWLVVACAGCAGASARPASIPTGAAAPPTPTQTANPYPLRVGEFTIMAPIVRETDHLVFPAWHDSGRCFLRSRTRRAYYVYVQARDAAVCGAAAPPPLAPVAVPTGPLQGQRTGPYLFVRTLARTADDTVYAARRDDGLCFVASLTSETYYVYGDADAALCASADDASAATSASVSTTASPTPAP
jgi:hypothetical protein